MAVRLANCIHFAFASAAALALFSSLARANCSDEMVRSEAQGPLDARQVEDFRQILVALEKGLTDPTCQARYEKLSTEVNSALEQAERSNDEIVKALDFSSLAPVCAEEAKAKAKLRISLLAYRATQRDGASEDSSAAARKTAEEDQAALEKINRSGGEQLEKFLDENIGRINALKRQYRSRGVIFGFSASGKLLTERALASHPDSFAHANRDICAEKPELKVIYEPTDHVQFHFPLNKGSPVGFTSLKHYPCFDPDGLEPQTIQGWLSLMKKPPDTNSTGNKDLRKEWADDMFPVLSPFGGAENTGAFAGKIDFLGDTFEGQVKNGIPEGRGRFKLANGGILDGNFENGIFLSGRIQTHDNSEYKGEIRGVGFGGIQQNGQKLFPHGTGRLSTSTGLIAEGTFEYGKLKNGTFKGPTSEPGIFYDGRIRDGTPAGGKFTDANGRPANGKSKPNLEPWYYKTFRTRPE